jgi:threonyl-tRNA synthetase
MNKESKKERPVVIHRAITGSLERFMSVLIEHFAGKFPLWLSPVQVKVVTINDSHLEFAQKIVDKMVIVDLRVELDSRVESMGKKVRDAQMEKVNYIITIGDKEIEQNSLAVRTRKGETKFGIPVDKFISELVKEVKERKL